LIPAATTFTKKTKSKNFLVGKKVFFRVETWGNNWVYKAVEGGKKESNLLTEKEWDADGFLQPKIQNRWVPREENGKKRGDALSLVKKKVPRAARPHISRGKKNIFCGGKLGARGGVLVSMGGSVGQPEKGLLKKHNGVGDDNISAHRGVRGGGGLPGVSPLLSIGWIREPEKFQKKKNPVTGNPNQRKSPLTF